MHNITKQLIEENIGLIEKNDLQPIYSMIAEHVLPIYWSTVFKELEEIFTNQLGLDTIAPRFKCFEEALQDLVYSYAEEVSEGLSNDLPFISLLKRYGICRFGFKNDELVKYVRDFKLLDLHWDGTHWKVHI